jgi:ubiquinone biosynthesis protein
MIEHQDPTASRRLARATALQNMRRLIAVARALLPEYRALPEFGKDKQDRLAPARFAAKLVALGPTFVKFGQMLSTRPGVLPQAYVAALATLQEHGPEIPRHLVSATISNELGKRVEVLFATFGWQSIAAASLAQVHRATLSDGTVVAVKVQRPDLERLICRDLDALEAGLKWLYRLSPRRMERTNLRAFLAEFLRYTLQDLDFSQEGRVIDRFRINFSGHANCHLTRLQPGGTVSATQRRGVARSSRREYRGA